MRRKRRQRRRREKKRRKRRRRRPRRRRKEKKRRWRRRRRRRRSTNNAVVQAAPFSHKHMCKQLDSTIAFRNYRKTVGCTCTRSRDNRSLHRRECLGLLGTTLAANILYCT